MSWDRHNTDYHLTTKGWVPGEPPPDRVETWNCSVHQRSGWSKEYTDWTCKWADPDTPRVERDALRDQHKSFMGTAGRESGRVINIGEPL